MLLLLSLVGLRYVDEARLSSGRKWYVRSSIPSAAIFHLPAFLFYTLRSFLQAKRAEGNLHLGGDLVAQIAIFIQRFVDDVFQLRRDLPIEANRR